MILDWLIECVRSAAYQYIPLVTSNHYDLKASKSFGLLRRTKHFGFKYDRGHIAREFAHRTTIPIPKLSCHCMRKRSGRLSDKCIMKFIWGGNGGRALGLFYSLSCFQRAISTRIAVMLSVPMPSLSCKSVAQQASSRFSTPLCNSAIVRLCVL